MHPSVTEREDDMKCRRYLMAMLASRQDRCITGLDTPGARSSLGSTMMVNPYGKSSVVDPDLLVRVTDPDPESFYHQAKIVRKT
jgi:hypothetical protein